MRTRQSITRLGHIRLGHIRLGKTLMRRSFVRNLLLGLAVATSLLPATARAWWNDDWSLRKPLSLDAGATGATINEPIGTLPVLVRLHTGNFDFGAAKDDGSDLRFVAGDDQTPLPFHIEKWDGLLGEAFVWVQVPNLQPGAKTELWLYYGNAKAQPAGDAKATFDASTVLAYHFAERNLPARDWTAWNNTAQNAGLPADGALIGDGLKLDGLSPIRLPDSPSLLWPAGGDLTWSAWIKADALQPQAALYARRQGGNAFVIGLDNGTPFVQVEDMTGLYRSFSIAPLAAGSWHHLAVTAGQGRMTMYVDGVATSTLTANLPALAGPALLGGDTGPAVAAPTGTGGDTGAAATDGAPGAAGAADDGTAPAAGPIAAPGTTAVQPVTPSAGFVGEIDELRIAKVARPGGYIKASAVGQGPDGATFLTVGMDEETASWISGYFAVILNSVTLDGWVVIAILMVMAVISWAVMADKALYLRRLEREDRRFEGYFRNVLEDLAQLHNGDNEAISTVGGQVPAEEQEKIRTSPLYRVYFQAAQEIRHRMKPGQGRPLSAEAMAAMRAALDAEQVRQNQKMNRLMVLLTIAISGGPFLGLLGTVVGVMITFAAIAASGDVNVNAIAPGIAAALVATVAGLAVAIPALFGYNWLLTRIKNATASMNVFVDELTTRLAESYSNHPESASSETVRSLRMPAE